MNCCRQSRPGLGLSVRAGEKLSLGQAVDLVLDAVHELLGVPLDLAPGLLHLVFDIAAGRLHLPLRLAAVPLHEAGRLVATLAQLALHSRPSALDLAPHAVARRGAATLEPADLARCRLPLREWLGGLHEAVARAQGGTNGDQDRPLGLGLDGAEICGLGLRPRLRGSPHTLLARGGVALPGRGRLSGRGAALGRSLGSHAVLASPWGILLDLTSVVIYHRTHVCKPWDRAGYSGVARGGGAAGPGEERRARGRSGGPGGRSGGPGGWARARRRSGALGRCAPRGR